MLDQSVTAILSTLLGGVLAITGGFLATTFSQRMMEKAEKRKLVRERVEEAYILSYQIKEYVTVQLLRACKVAEVTLHHNVPGWFFDTVDMETACSIEKMKMIIDLYLPDSKKPFLPYQKSVLAVQQVEINLRNRYYTKYSLEKYCKEKLVVTPEMKKRIEDSGDVVVEFVILLLSEFEENQTKLQASLQTMVTRL